jgi:hypothetical protein
LRSASGSCGIVGPHPQRSARHAAERPHCDRLVDDPGQPYAARVVTRREARDDRNEAQDDERRHDEFHG